MSVYADIRASEIKSFTSEPLLGDRSHHLLYPDRSTIFLLIRMCRH